MGTRIANFKTGDFDEVIVTVKPPSTVDVAEPLSTEDVAEPPSTEDDVAEQTSEITSTSSVPETVHSPNPHRAEEPRYPRRERHKPARFKDYVCG